MGKCVMFIYRYHFVDVRQTGIMGFTTTGHPLVGQIAPGHYISVGFNGHGMPIAPGWCVFLRYPFHLLLTCLQCRSRSTDDKSRSTRRGVEHASVVP